MNAIIPVYNAEQSLVPTNQNTYQIQKELVQMMEVQTTHIRADYVVRLCQGVAGS